jgi:hypothetical protein
MPWLDVGVTDPNKRQYKKWEYPFKKWPRDEKFWFDMTTRTLSSIVALAVVGLIVLVAGLDSRDSQWKFVISALFVFGLLLMFVVMVLLASLVWEEFGPRKTHYYPDKGGVSFRLGRGILKNRFSMSPSVDTDAHLPEWEIYKDRVFARYAEMMEDPKNHKTSLAFNYRDLSTK